MGWIFWADDLKCRVVRDEPVQRFSIGIGYPAVSCVMFGVEVASYNGRVGVVQEGVTSDIETSRNNSDPSASHATAQPLMKEMSRGGSGLLDIRLCTQAAAPRVTVRP